MLQSPQLEPLKKARGKMTANNVTRMLDAKKVAYQAFEVPAVKLSALEVADYLGLSPGEVFKTIVCKRLSPGKHILALVPATSEVNSKKLASALNDKKIAITSQDEAERMTGLLSGGISPLALLNKGFQVVIDASAHEREHIIVSAGQRGLQVRISVDALARLTQARFAEIAEKK